jgi:protocatechuate 3,4-dioxygenase beta subunit
MFSDRRRMARDSVLRTRWVALVALTLAMAFASPVAASANPPAARSTVPASSHAAIGILGSPAGPVGRHPSVGLPSAGHTDALHSVPALAAKGSNGSTLIFGNGDNSGEISNALEPLENLRKILTRAGDSVTVQRHLPLDLGGIHTIWYVGIEPLSSAEQAELVGFVKNGGGLYLTGERPCCEDMNRSDEALIAALAYLRPLKIGNGSDVDSAYESRNTVNANAIDGVSQLPDKLSSWVPSAPGVIEGLATRNALTFAYQGGMPVMTGEVWDGPNIIGGNGRLAILMDINWLESAYWEPTSTQGMTLDLERFLQGGDFHAQPQGDAYVALGDSYSSGEGNPKFEPDTNTISDDCHRSEEKNGAYPIILDNDLGHPSFAFVACSGATTGNIWSSPDPPQGVDKDPEPLQIGALSSATRVVTLTAGGDDVDFASVLTACIEHSYECSSEGISLAPASLRNAPRNIKALQHTLEETYKEIKRAAPDAHIYVLGYPDVFPQTAPNSDACFDKTFLELPSIEWLIERQKELDAVVDAAAHTVGVDYVDPNTGAHSFVGHDICSSDSWFHDVWNWHPTSYSFHPTTTGQEHLAATLFASGVSEASVSESVALAHAHAGGLHPSAHQNSDSKPQVEPDTATLSGTVTAVAGAPLGGIEVYVETAEGAFAGSSETGSDGSYTVTGLAAGDYKVEFYANGQYYETQWYRDKISEDNTDAIALTSGENDTEVNAVLAPDATISGRVTSASGEPLVGASVQVESMEGGSGRSAETGLDGTYSVAGLPAGNYKVEFSLNQNGFDASGQYYEAQWYKGQASESTANTVTLTSGQNAEDIDAALAADATLSGTISTVEGEPLVGIEVFVESTEGGSYESADTEENGKYTVYDLPAGNYKVEFYANGQYYESQWYKSETSEAGATVIALSAGENDTGVNAALNADATISGTVTAAGGDPLQGVAIYVQSTEGGSSGNATTEANGTYTVPGLPAGNYKVEFYANGQYYETQWYKDEGSEAEADVLTLTAGESEMGIDAALEPEAALSGTVTATDGEPLSGVEVLVQSTDGGVSQGADTRADGTYTVNGLPADSYTVEFDATGQYYAVQWYRDASSQESANVITLTPGESYTEANAALTPTAATVRGETTSGNGQPLSGVEVVLVESEGAIAATATTEPDGLYVVNGLRAGVYTVEFQPSLGDYLPQYYDGQSSPTTASQLTLQAGTVASSIDAVLQSASTISGTVTASEGGDLSGVEVSVYDESGAFVQAVTSGAEGTYIVSGLSAGTYTVQFEPAGTDYIGQFYDEKSDGNSATSVVLAAGASKEDIDAKLSKGATVDGTVTAAGGGPLEDVEVHVQPTSGGVGGSAITGADGSYSVPGLQPGSYTVEFEPVDSSYAGQYYDNTAEAATAHLITLSSGATEENINATLSSGGSIGGTVTDAQTDAPVDGVQVSVGPAEGGGQAITTTTGEDGTYSVSGLSPGKYVVAFEPNEADYVGQYFDGKSGAGSAGEITLEAGAGDEHVDASLVQSATVTGNVTDAKTGSPIQGATVFAQSIEGGVTRTATTGEGGSYSVSGLPAGSYTIEFAAEGQNYLNQFYDNQSKIGTAQSVVLSAGETKESIDAALAGGVTVTGTVTNAQSGEPVSGVEVYVQSTEGGPGGTATTGTDGSYLVAGLPAGSYTVQFEPTGANDIGQYYNGQDDVGKADPVTLAPGARKEGIDAELTSGATVSGTVTDAQSNEPLGGIEVDAYTSACDRTGGYGITDAEGDYTIQGLPEGTYHVVFNPDGGSYEAGLSSKTISLAKGASEKSVNEALVATLVESAPATLGCGAVTIPVSLSPPTIAGSAVEGQTITESHGDWSNNPMSYGYQWERCNSSGDGCQAISGATSQTHTLAQADVGSTIRVRETAGNVEGAGAPAVSAPTAVVQAAASGDAAPSGTGSGNSSSSAGGTNGSGPGNGAGAGGGTPGGGMLTFKSTHPAKPLTRVQKLAKALQACHKLKKSRRKTCEARARKRYAPKPKKKTK